MKVEQFVMAYEVEQDRLRAMLPENFQSIRPVLRINTEIRKVNETETIYIELNTPVAAFEKRGWLNIECWESPATSISYNQNGKTVSIDCPFLEITYTCVGIEGGCPAEKDNDGCFFIGEQVDFRPNELVDKNKEFCNCEFRWKFAEGNSSGVYAGSDSLPAYPTKSEKQYEKKELSAPIAASIKCEQILGSYVVRFER